MGLSGGIGSGKSTVSERLTELGALVIDADRIARDVVAPGTPGLAAVVESFGPQVLSTDGRLDRPALGAIVFADEGARRELESIVHPLVRDETARRREEAPRDAIVVHDVPLLVEGGLAPDYHLTVIVDATQDVRSERLRRDRGMTDAQARARIAAQATDDARYAVADVLVDNNGTREALVRQVETLWRERLSPFNENLVMGRGAPPASGAGDPASAARSVARLRRQLDAAGIGEEVERLRVTDDGLIQLRLASPPAVGPFGVALRAAGFAAGPRPSLFASCDPAAPVLMELQIAPD